MYQFLSKNGQMIGFGLGLFVTLLFVISILMGYEAFSTASSEEQFQMGLFDIGLYGVIAMAFLAALGAIVFGIIHTVGDLKGSMRGLMGIGALLLVFAIFYFTASGEPSGIVKAAVDKFQLDNGAEISSGNFKFIGASINTVMALGAVGVLALIASEVLNLFK